MSETAADILYLEYDEDIHELVSLALTRNVRAVTSNKESALSVPQRAVTELQGTYKVAVVGSDNKAVKVGERTDSNWIIEDGLKAGESIIVEGIQKVRPGAMVNPKSLGDFKLEELRPA